MCCFFLLAAAPPKIDTSLIVGSVRMCIRDRYGRLARVGDPEDVARALREALSHPLPSEDLRGRAAFFSEERAAEAWLELFRDLASS